MTDDTDGVDLNITYNSTLTSDGSDDVTDHGSYVVGVLFGLLGSSSRAAHYVLCKLIYDQQQSQDVTSWILLYAGFGGFLVSLISSCIDTEHLILSTNIDHLSLGDWSGLIIIALLGKQNIIRDLKRLYPSMTGLEPAIPRSEVWCLIH